MRVLWFIGLFEFTCIIVVIIALAMPGAVTRSLWILLDLAMNEAVTILRLVTLSLAMPGVVRRPKARGVSILHCSYQTLSP